MLFNSYEFIFAFLPVTLIGFYLIGQHSRDWAIRWLIVASLFFYAWWRPVNLLLITPSILINYAMARTLLKWSDDETKSRQASILLVLGVAFNLTFLGYFKYVNFLRGTVNDVFGANLVLTHLILPLGISFITFQKIAFLVDVQSGRVKSFTFQDYCTFVLFFPQLIAGPIVHYREMMPQFQKAPCRFDSENLAVGLTLFFFGLFKKLILADSIAPYIAGFYTDAAAGSPISFLPAWLAGIGFTLQIYFDFSGYSDMALGLARFFGIQLPPNFNSPLKSTNIIDFWARWHMTLSRFLTAYLYNPISLSLTRRRLAKGRAGFGGRNTTFGAFLTLLMFPTLLTMSLAGLWHGAGWTFVMFGTLHGIYLTVDNGWRLIRPKFWPDNASYNRVMKPVGFLILFVCIVSANVFFRSTSVAAAVVLLKGMIGLHGVSLPIAVFDRLGPVAAWLHNIGITEIWWSGYGFMMTMIWTLFLLAVAFIPPNTLQIMGRYEPAIGIKVKPADKGGVTPRVSWHPSTGWAMGMAVVAAVGILALGKLSEFLYWQF